jgi:phosphoglycolate phosphatase
MTTYLFWDIDGTLLTTARAGIFAWEEAADEVLGGAHDFSQLKTAGLTDFEIAVLIAGEERRDKAVPLLRAYEAAVPAHLGRRRGHVLPNVRENLEVLAARDDIVSMLLTGNVEGGARAKLAHYGLLKFFEETGGAFCVEGADRPSIARRALELAARNGGQAPDVDRMVVIGDTPQDVSCGKAIGARTLAVATGGYTFDDLRAANADMTLQLLPPPGDFLALLSRPRATEAEKA